MAVTYEPIATTTTTNNGSVVTFTSIPQTYTDLRIVMIGNSSPGSGNNSIQINFNNDMTNSYSNTYISGNGTAATATRVSNLSSLYIGYVVDSSIPSITIADIFSYTGTANKSILSSSASDQVGSGFSWKMVGTWQNSPAITTINFTLGAVSYRAGTTITLYGIKAA